jgi:hypothetical protein
MQYKRGGGTDNLNHAAAKIVRRSDGNFKDTNSFGLSFVNYEYSLYKYFFFTKVYGTLKADVKDMYCFFKFMPHQPACSIHTGENLTSQGQ